VGRDLRRFLALLVPHRAAYALGAVALVFSDGGQLLIAYLIGHAIDRLGSGDATGSDLTGYAAVMVACAAVIATSRYLWRVLIFGSARRLERDLRQRLFEHLQTLSPRFFMRHKVGELMAHGTNDIAAIEIAASLGVLAGLDAIIQFAGAAAMMVVTVDARLAVLSLLPLVALTPATYVLGRRLHVAYGHVQAAFADLSDRVQESVEGIRVVKGFAREEARFDRFQTTNFAYRDTYSRMLRYDAAFDPMIGGLAGLAFAVGLGYGGYLVATGAVSLGRYVSFNTYLAMLVWPMLALGWVTNLLQRAAASMARIDGLLETPPDIADGPDALDLPAVRGAVTFRELTFRYAPDEPPALEDVSIDLPAGATLGVLGRTGSGKSTLAQLLVRLFEPPAQTVLLDGHDVTGIRLASLRGAIAYVPQDAFLFSRSIADNIALGPTHHDRADIERAARMADLERDVRALAEGYDTVVGERGVTLSGGQRQRVALARALLRDAPVLVLDDCLSAVDTATEQRILAALRAYTRRRTTIIVSHRVSAVRHADEIVVLAGGRVVERGAHAELLERDGEYARLYRRQQLELALEERAP
jgi:ATP-binding cassette, subfamily B, multidrug efflux pump